MAQSVAVRPSGGSRTWTVIDGSFETVAPVEEWLEAHRYLGPDSHRQATTSTNQQITPSRGTSSSTGRTQDSG
jgi:hypothetical protein